MLSRAGGSYCRFRVFRSYGSSRPRYRREHAVMCRAFLSDKPLPCGGLGAMLSMDDCPSEPLDLQFRCDSVSESAHLSHVFPPC